MEDITPTRLAEAANISVPYASQIMSGNRIPPRSLAIHILRRTGWRAPVIAELTDEQIDVFESVERWAPKADAA